MVINGSDTRAYVMNLVSRDISVIDISGSDPSTYKEIARIASSTLPNDAFALKAGRSPRGVDRQSSTQRRPWRFSS